MSSPVAQPYHTYQVLWELPSMTVKTGKYGGWSATCCGCRSPGAISSHNFDCSTLPPSARPVPSPTHS